MRTRKKTKTKRKKKTKTRTRRKRTTGRKSPRMTKKKRSLGKNLRANAEFPRGGPKGPPFFQKKIARTARGSRINLRTRAHIRVAARDRPRGYSTALKLSF